MKKILATTFLFSLFILFSGSVLAQNKFNHLRTSQKSGERIILEVDEVVDRDFFAAGEIVELYGTVNGDVYVAGGQVLLKGTINGDLLAAGGQVIVDGVITQDARVAGGEINIRGDIGRNLTVAGGRVSIVETANIEGSVVAGAGDTEIDGEVSGNVSIGSGNLIISGLVAGDVEAGVGALRLTPDASVGGNLVYWSEDDASISENAQVSGEINKIVPSQQIAGPDVEDLEKGLRGFKRTVNLIMVPLGFASALLVGLILQRLAPKFILEGVEVISKKPWYSLGLGFLVLILTPVAFLFLLVTVIGIPIAFIILFKYLIAIYLSKIFVSFWAGRKVLDALGSKNRRGWALFSGLVLYYVFTNIPFVGGLISALVLFAGLGAIVIMSKDLFLRAKEKRLI